MAANNHYTLDENVRNLVYQKNVAIKAAQIAAKGRKKAAESRKNDGLHKALQKFNHCPNGLTVPDLQALVTATAKTGDSPVKKKKEELLQQLYREPRYTRVKELASDYRLTLHAAATEATTAEAAAAEALVSIVAPETIPASAVAPVAPSNTATTSSMIPV